MADVSTLQIELDAGRVHTGIDRIEKNLNDLARSVGKVDRSMGKMQGGASKALGGLKIAAVAAAAAFAAIGVGKLGGEIITINADFQKLQASLVTVTGSTEKAKAAFGALQQFAAKTPYSLQEVTGAFIKMRSYGLESTEEALTSFGNTASAMGKSLDQMVEAVADAAMGEFERLKEFGVKSQKVGDEIIFTFGGVQTAVANNAESIQGYLEDIGNTKFAGGMDRQAKTIGGALSNLGDTAQSVAYAFGQGGFNDAFSDFIRTMEGGLSSLKPFAAELGKMAGESLTSLTHGLITATAAVTSFLDETQQIGGVAASNGEIMQASFSLMGDYASEAFSAMLDYAKQWGNAFGDIGTEVFGFFAKGWSESGDEVKFAVVAWTEYIYTFFSVVGTFMKNLPSLFAVTFKSAGAAIVEFVKAAKDTFLNGNLDAWDGFMSRIDDGFTKEWGRVIGDVKTTVEEGAGVITEAWGQIGTEGGVQLNSRLITKMDDLKGEIVDRIVSNRADAAKAGAEVGEAAGKSLNDALRDETKQTRSVLQEAGISIETFKNRMEGLIGTYLPTTARTQELQRAVELVGLAAKMSNEELAKYGLTQEMVANLSGKLAAAQANVRSFFEQNVEDLRDEQLSIMRQAVGTAEMMAEERILQIKRQARAMNEELTPAEEAGLRQLILRNEQLKKGNDLEKQRFSIVNDMEQEVKLLRFAGKEREKMAKILDFEQRARDSGVSETEIRRQSDLLRQEMEQIDAAKEKFNSFAVGARDAFVEYAESIKDVAGRTKDGIGEIMGSMEDGLTEFFATGKFGMNDFLKDINYMLARFASQQIMGNFAALMGGLTTGMANSGFSFGNLFGGFREAGGPVEAGKAYVVGEKRPELFIPSTSGHIIPSVPTGGGQTNVTMDIRIDSVQGVGGGVEAQQQLINGILTKVHTMLVENQVYGGALAVRR